jgi:hypothetical protein
VHACSPQAASQGDTDAQQQQQQPVAWLLELPKPALQLVLGWLGQRSLACVAVTCSALSDALASYLSSVTITKPEAGSYTAWLEQHSSSIAHVTQCSFDGQFASCLGSELHDLPCPQLRQLHLQEVGVQLGAADGYPGVLHDCTGLTSLALDGCVVQDVPAAAAALAALPELQRLTLSGNVAVGWVCLLEELPQLTQLTRLSIKSYGVKQDSLRELSALVNLQHLTLQPSFLPDGLPATGMLPGGVPSQLVNLTCLNIRYPGPMRNSTTKQLQHLSSLTALRQLSCDISDLATDDLTALRYLSQLTGLQLETWGSDLVLSTSSISSWACQAGLRSLLLKRCTLQPNVLLVFDNLHSLDLRGVAYHGRATFEELLEAVSQLSLLSTLALSPSDGLHPPAEAFTTLTASTQLSSLRLCLWDDAAPRHYVLFQPDTVYPQLRVLDLCHERSSPRNKFGAWPQSDEQLQQLCSCCPALEHLEFVVRQGATAEALLPLLELPALTRLAVLGGSGAAAIAVLGVAAQLTGLRQLTLEYLPPLTHPALLQLTALTGLEQLVLRVDFRDVEARTHTTKLVLQNKVMRGALPR